MQLKDKLIEVDTTNCSKIMNLLHDLLKNLQEFQEAINYCIYCMLVSKSAYTVRKEVANAAFYLRELSLQLHMLEEIME